MTSESARDIDKIANAAIRRHVLPIFRELGFQRVSQTVCERWDGGSTERPDRYFRLHLVRRPNFLSAPGEYAVGVEVTVHHPMLENPDCGTRLDAKNRYSPKIAEVFRARHSVELWSPDLLPEWEAGRDQIDPMFQELERCLLEEMVPMIRKLADPAFEVTHLLEVGDNSPDAVRAKVAEASEDVEAGKDMAPDRQLVWITRERPACFHDDALREPVDGEDWQDPVVSALLNRSHSLHYAAAYAERYLSSKTGAELREIARAFEGASGVELEPIAAPQPHALST